MATMLDIQEVSFRNKDDNRHGQRLQMDVLVSTAIKIASNRLQPRPPLKLTELDICLDNSNKFGINN